jgi:hypothetical protein
MELLRNERAVDGNFDIVWPLGKSHYLTIPSDVMSTDLPSETTSPPPMDPIPATGRDLAARALLAATGCTQQRVSDLLDTSRRSIGRATESDVVGALQNAAVVAEARTVLAHSATRGSTVEERQAAEAWLAQALQEDGAGEASPRRAPSAHRRKPIAKPAVPLKNGRPKSAPSIPQIAALERQQQRILHRTQLVEYVLATEHRNGVTLALADALIELLSDITEAARTSVTILQQAAGARPSVSR